MTRKIILASKSRARKIIFSSLGLPFEVIPAHIDEQKIRDKDLSIRSEKLARAKAEKVKELSDGIIISADTYSEFEGRVLEKPKDIKEAKDFLKLISGKKALNYTGLCYIDERQDINFSTVVKTSYKIRELYDNEIDIYVKKYPVTEWAGGFALIEPYITTFVSSVKGSYTSLAYGLPTEVLIPLLKKSGFEPNPSK